MDEEKMREIYYKYLSDLSEIDGQKQHVERERRILIQIGRLADPCVGKKMKGYLSL